MSRFNAIDLSQLPPPQLIETIVYEDVLLATKAWVTVVWEAVRSRRPDLPPLDTLDLESEPVAIVLQAQAYRETLLRALVNDKARAVLLAYAVGTDLDHIAALFGVTRMVDGNVIETDDRLRRRVQLAPEAFSVAGPAGAYEFHALTRSLDIADCHAFTPDPNGPGDGRVTVALAGRNGAPVSDAVLLSVVQRLERDDVVPLTDVVMVQRAARVDYAVSATLIVPRGPDPELIRAAAEISLRRYALERYRIGHEVFRVGLTAALKVAGVDNVILAAPLADVVCGEPQIPFLTDVTLTVSII